MIFAEWKTRRRVPLSNREPPIGNSLIVDRLVRQLMHLTIQFQFTRRMQLRHEHDDHLLFRIDRERRIEESTPLIRTRTTQLRERLLHAIDPKTQPKTLVGAIFPN